ncbi:hypothetical protein ABZ926_32980 [Streptomyces litmocidini]|uniref:Uncharacterized protein n=1 Tax=Streptomyces litmocidini TaxID=67318 RepID=A0ABW7U3H5_9ACTN|nr:hypothetical protein [Streptomyces sp. PanSC19]
MAELAGYARFRDAMERSHAVTADPARPEREPATTASAVTTSPSS